MKLLSTLSVASAYEILKVPKLSPECPLVQFYFQDSFKISLEIRTWFTRIAARSYVWTRIRLAGVCVALTRYAVGTVVSS